MSAVDRVKKYVGEVMVEAKKVTWPSREELRESTTVVLVAVLIISVFIYIVDIVISKGVQTVL
jgi:preprotein translocase subunit SecE